MSQSLDPMGKLSRRAIIARLTGLVAGAGLLPLSTTFSLAGGGRKKKAALKSSTAIEDPFIDDEFLLHSKTAQTLYQRFARDIPIIDFHCHLPPEEIASNKQFSNLTKIWLEGDHYKMRLMRANGIGEDFITGSAPDEVKFQKWAETLPYMLRSPLYHWTHLELKRYFDIDELLDGTTAQPIFKKATALLQTERFRTQRLIEDKNVEILCTTDDPADDLRFHRQIAAQGYKVKVLPAWRPDKVMAVEDGMAFAAYLDKLGKAAGREISSYAHLLEALLQRQAFFHAQGCRLSDHGITNFYSEPYKPLEIGAIFSKLRMKKEVTRREQLQFKSAILRELAEMNHSKGWVQQFHIGALRNNNTRMFQKLGGDKGYDSTDDGLIAQHMSRFFDDLEGAQKLAKTIVYNLNPAANAVMATMVGNFNDGSTPGKIQWGAAWWFNDQKEGITQQLNTLSNTGLLGRFVGMLTDSRSFLSYPRHEYFRRVLCDLLATDIERKELPDRPELVGKLIQDICYYNAKSYFSF